MSMAQIQFPFPTAFGTGFEQSSGGALSMVNRVNLGIASQLVQVLEMERTRLVSGVSREWNISLLSTMLIVSLLLFSPIFSLFVLPAFAYGVLTWFSDRKKLKQITKALKVVKKLSPSIRERISFSQ